MTRNQAAQISTKPNVSTHFQTTPIGIPIPDHLILFSPHPDDIAISMGALAAWAAPRVPVTIVLMTDGSEAQLPEHVLELPIHQNATVGKTASQRYDARGGGDARGRSSGIR
jgi:hypothetical protein